MSAPWPGYTPSVVPFAVIAFDFDPYLRLDVGAVRWETLGIAASIMLALIAAAVIAGRTPGGADPASAHLRRDDLLFVALGIVPGAVIGGRLGYALLHLGYYLDHPGALLDANAGGLQLSLAVAGGTITGLYVARLLEVPIGRGLHVAAVPLLLAIEGGKLAMAWGGTGQGQADSADWATAYLGPGPWGSLAPAVPSVPSQVLEGIATGGVAALLVVAMAAGGSGRRDGRLYIAALVGWLLVRLVVAGTWRDPAVIGPLNADQVISLALLAVTFVALLVAARRPTREPSPPGGEPAWPDLDEAVRWRGRPNEPGGPASGD